MATLIGDLKVKDSALFFFDRDLYSILCNFGPCGHSQLPWFRTGAAVYLHVFGVFIVAVEHVCK